MSLLKCSFYTPKGLLQIFLVFSVFVPSSETRDQAELHMAKFWSDMKCVIVSHEHRRQIPFAVNNNVLAIYRLAFFQNQCLLKPKYLVEHSIIKMITKFSLRFSCLSYFMSVIVCWDRFELLNWNTTQKFVWTRIQCENQDQIYTDVTNHAESYPNISHQKTGAQ